MESKINHAARSERKEREEIRGRARPLKNRGASGENLARSETRVKERVDENYTHRHRDVYAAGGRDGGYNRIRDELPAGVEVRSCGRRASRVYLLVHNEINELQPTKKKTKEGKQSQSRRAGG